MSMKKRLLALALAGVLTTGFSGCKKEEKVNKDFLNHYDNYTQMDIVDESIINQYDLGIEFKEWYTVEEIRDIAKVIVNRNTMIKKLTRN